MFDFIQRPSRTGGTIARLVDGDVLMQVAFHAGSDNYGETFLRISASVITEHAGQEAERFHMQYHMMAHSVPYIDDAVCITDAFGTKVHSVKESRHAA